MKQFFNWLNDGNDSIVKAGIAHLWFVTIQPFDDGNGRIAIYSLKRGTKAIRFYSLSDMILEDKRGYYDVLEATTSSGLDITICLEWLLETLLKSLKLSRKNVQYVLQKTAFWDKHKSTVLNEREIKVLNRLLDAGDGNFEGGINTRKYASLTKVSKNTASRELKGLVEKACLVQKEGTSGRNVAYELRF